MADNPTVFVVDDDPGALRSLCWLLQQRDLQVRAFNSGKAFLDACGPDESGCLVLDIQMPELDGLEVQQGMRQRGIELPVIFLTAHGDVPNCAQAFRDGAFDFLEKPADDETLLDRIAKAIARDAQRRAQGSAPEFAARAERLTPTEKDVLELLVAGKSLKQIAAARGVTVQTIWRHRESVLEKMEVENTAALIRAAIGATHEH
jgi:two-component system, LuxR family, response regulator FixJ